MPLKRTDIQKSARKAKKKRFCQLVCLPFTHICSCPPVQCVCDYSVPCSVCTTHTTIIVVSMIVEGLYPLPSTIIGCILYLSALWSLHLCWKIKRKHLVTKHECWRVARIVVRMSIFP